MKWARVSEKAMRMSDATWQRHANPWSGWTRVVTLPLLAIAAWSRLWIGWWALLPLATVLLWVWINPRLFPVPKSTDNWMSQGVLGERIWLAHEPGTIPGHHRRVVRILIGISAGGSILFLLGLLLLDLTMTLVGMSIAMLAKLWLLDRMVWILKDQRG